METNLERRIYVTEELLDHHNNIGGSSLNGADFMILTNQLAIMKELQELKLDTKTILTNIL
jgi:hypothetical protein